MALVLPLLFGLAITPFLGGRWSRLGNVRLRAVPLFYVALALQLGAFPTQRLPWRTPDKLAIVLWLASYLVFGAALARNARIRGVPLVAIGMLSNVVAIVSNGGHMPALPSALRGAGLHFEQSRNSIAAAHPHLVWLVDRWAAPKWLPWGNVFSVGDIVIGLGGLIFALAVTGALREDEPNARPKRSQVQVWQLVVASPVVSVLFVPFGLPSVVTAFLAFPVVAGATAWLLLHEGAASQASEPERPVLRVITAREIA